MGGCKKSAACRSSPAVADRASTWLVYRRHRRCSPAIDGSLTTRSGPSFESTCVRIR